MIAQSDLALLAKAILAGALGFIIGWEREHAGSPAGDRTFALVAMGGAVLSALALEMFPASADRVIAGAVTGIGFLGAGMILRGGTGEIRGLTTAASLWAINAVGVVIGSGRYLTGTALAALVFIVLIWDRLPFLSRVGSRHSNVIEGDDPHASG